MNAGLDDKHALVLGGSRGLGYACAKSLADEGARLTIAARASDALSAASRELGAHMVPIDLSAPGSGSIVVQSATLKHGCPDVIIINGGGPPKATLLQSTQGGWANAIQSLLGLAVEAMREVIPSMIERHWGRVIVITSIAGKEPETDLVYSNTLRAGIHGLVKTCSNEVAANGVTVNAVLPGYTATDRMRQLNATGIEMRIPAGRLGKPEEIAGLVTFLASEIAGYITGQCIACDGGLTRSH